nr:reverse transcriptase domain-containing protein [Tanacetum cinerariifolium]
MTANENYDSESDEEEPKFEKITINTDYKIKTSLEEPPMDLELKPLPDNLEYVFLEEPSFVPAENFILGISVFKHIADSEEFVNVFVRIGFGSTIKLVSFDESQVVTFNGKFVCGFRNSDCGTESQSDNTVGSPHGFIIHWIVILKNIKKVMEVIDVDNWQIDNSRVLRWIVSLFEWNSSVSSMKSLIQSMFSFSQMGSAAHKILYAAYLGS